MFLFVGVGGCFSLEITLVDIRDFLNNKLVIYQIFDFLHKTFSSGFYILTRSFLLGLLFLFICYSI